MRRIAIAAALMVASTALIGAGWQNGSALPLPMGTPHMPPPPSGQGQLVDGAALYRLYCVTCHGDLLRGLTPEWIAQWPAQDQNCWKSKCHGPQHPQGGFVLPRTVPPLSGPDFLASFHTAVDLHAFMRARMPYQEPGWLDDSEYWAIVAYILDHDGLDVPEVLDAGNGAQLLLSPGSGSQPTATGSPTAATTPVAGVGTRTVIPSAATTAASGQGSPAMTPTVAAIAVGLGAVVGVILFVRRRRTGPG
jgi:mono/diheme cytochrome c family protein